VLFTSADALSRIPRDPVTQEPVEAVASVEAQGERVSVDFEPLLSQARAVERVAVVSYADRDCVPDMEAIKRAVKDCPDFACVFNYLESVTSRGGGR